MTEAVDLEESHGWFICLWSEIATPRITMFWVFFFFLEDQASIVFMK